MAILGVIGFLLLAAGLIVVTHLVKPNVGRSWFIALGSSAGAWLVIFFLRLYLPTVVPLIAWKPESLFFASPELVLDYVNWPYALAIITLCMGVIFTDSSRTSLGRSPLVWASSLAITAVNLVAVLAGDPLTMAMAWALVDALELGSLLMMRGRSGPPQRMATYFGLRILSTFTLIGATAIGWQIKPQFLMSEIPATAGIFFLAAAGLRLGVLPPTPIPTDSEQGSSGSSLLLRLLPVASALALIGWLPTDFLILQQGWLSLFRALTVIAALYAAGMWLTRKTLAEARPYWLMALSAFAIQCALNNQAGASRVWGLALLLSGGLLFLFDPPIRRIRFLMAFGLIGLIALPYTPAASGWAGLLGGNLSFSSVLMIISHAMLTLGYLRYIAEGNSTITGLEKHARITYPAGLILIGQTIVIIGILGWPGVFTVGAWWGGAASLALSAVSVLVFKRFGLRLPLNFSLDRLPAERLLRTGMGFLAKALSLQWLYQLGSWIYHAIQAVGAYASQILEGPGGLLWSLVLLAVAMIIFLSQVSLP